MKKNSDDLPQESTSKSLQGWVKMSRCFAVDFPKDRPFTRLEAAYSAALDKYEGKSGTLRGYATLWGWNHHRVKRFLEEIQMLNCLIKNNQTNVPLASHQRPTGVPPKASNISKIDCAISHQRPNSVPLASRTIIEKKRKETYDDFWSAYPRKTGKAQALKIWQHLNPSPDTIAAIMTALDWQRKQPDWLKDGGRFIPHPSTWLNGRRWEDEQPTARADANGEPRRLQVAL